MPLHVTIDCSDPHAQARFWASALGWEVEDLHDLIGGVIDAGHIAADSDEIVEIDGRRAWRDMSRLMSPDGDGSRVLLQRVPEPKTAKNRVHLDIAAPAGDRDALVEQLLGLGATKLWDGQQGPMSWVTLADPEGNELCVS
jgi:catechol 2,3-dioxygenase-like lactoylglutathione lyase family enzyme